ncbi:hypothetical protein [Coxiella burnetii]|uniref:hypothetical protein n=1 Tax=Coxiella burnetii TaxID=777 RepID=UPI0000DAE935|nr:hypothetical protein [Coxiella burnetii]
MPVSFCSIDSDFDSGSGTPKIFIHLKLGDEQEFIYLRFEFNIKNTLNGHSMETACYLVYEYDEEYPLRVGLIIVGVQEKEDQEGRLERLFGVHPPGKSDPLSQKLQVFLPSSPVSWKDFPIQESDQNAWNFAMEYLSNELSKEMAAILKESPQKPKYHWQMMLKEKFKERLTNTDNGPLYRINHTLVDLNRIDLAQIIKNSRLQEENSKELSAFLSPLFFNPECNDIGNHAYLKAIQNAANRIYVGCQIFHGIKTSRPPLANTIVSLDQTLKTMEDNFPNVEQKLPYYDEEFDLENKTIYVIYALPLSSFPKDVSFRIPPTKMSYVPLNFQGNFLGNDENTSSLTLGYVDIKKNNSPPQLKLELLKSNQEEKEESKRNTDKYFLIPRTVHNLHWHSVGMIPSCVCCLFFNK